MIEGHDEDDLIQQGMVSNRANCTHVGLSVDDMLVIHVDDHPLGHRVSIGAAMTAQEDEDDDIAMVHLFKAKDGVEFGEYTPLPAKDKHSFMHKVPASSVLVHFSALTPTGKVPVGVQRQAEQLLLGHSRLATSQSK